MKNELSVAIGERIKRQRNKLNLSQRELAERANLRHHQIISQIEQGKRHAKAWELQFLAEALQINVRDLLCEEQVKEPVILWCKPGEHFPSTEEKIGGAIAQPSGKENTAIGNLFIESIRNADQRIQEFGNAVFSYIWILERELRDAHNTLYEHDFNVITNLEERELAKNRLGNAWTRL